MPSIGDLTRIRTNVSALNALNALKQINDQLNITNLRLATGKRINSAADDPAGLTLANGLALRARRIGAAINNIGDAQNLLSIAESGLSSINDILATMMEKLTLAANDTQGTSERDAILQELQQLGSEIDALTQQTQYNGKILLTAGALTSRFVGSPNSFRPFQAPLIASHSSTVSAVRTERALVRARVMQEVMEEEFSVEKARNSRTEPVPTRASNPCFSGG
mgnify:CR=1 FL=1